MKKCYFCKEEMENNDIDEQFISEKSKKCFHLSSRCYHKYLFEKNKCPICKKKITINSQYKIDNNKYYHVECWLEKEKVEKERESWEKLYNYVKSNVLKYQDNMSLSKTQIFDLKNLREGKLIRKGDKFEGQGYSYEDILLCFILSKNDIEKAISDKTFQNENKKFKYIIAIIRNRINDIIIIKERNIKSNKNVQEKSEQISNDYYCYNSNYNKKSTINKDMEDLIENW